MLRSPNYDDKTVMNGPDERLQQVVEHWTPRIQTAGIAALDAARVTAEAGEWRNWCTAWSREAERHIASGEAAEAQGRLLTAGEAYTRAALWFHFAQFMFFDDLAQKDEASRRKVEIYQRAAPLLIPPARRMAVPYGDGKLYGYLRRPTADPSALVVLVPGSDSTKEEFPSLEEHFLRRGLATFSVDGPGQGEGREHGHLTPNWGPVLRAIADALRAESTLNGDLGVMGMAFGGHLALQGAHAIADLKALVCMNGFYDLGAFWDELPPVYRANMRYALGGTDVNETRERARAFTLTRTPPPACPTLVVHGALDKIFPIAEAQRVRDYAGRRAEIVEYAQGNHVCNNLAYQYRPLMADWFAERLGGQVAPRGD